MTEVLHDESTFPEYNLKVQKEKKRAIQTALGGVLVYVILADGLAFLVFPGDPPQAKVRGALILLVIPIFFGVITPIGYWLNTRNPRRVTDDALLLSVSRIPLKDILEVVWQGPEGGAEVILDPKKYWVKTLRIRGESLLRPEEFLRALEGRMLVTP